jgi:peptide/nickel transport system substrate-binding protein
MQGQSYSRGLILIMLVGLLVGQPVAWGQQPQSGGTLTVGLAADIAHFDVFHAIGYEAYWALENIHSGLVRVDPQGNIIPDMATSWDIQDEGRT